MEAPISSQNHPAPDGVSPAPSPVAAAGEGEAAARSTVAAVPWPESLGALALLISYVPMWFATVGEWPSMFDYCLNAIQRWLSLGRLPMRLLIEELLNAAWFAFHFFTVLLGLQSLIRFAGWQGFIRGRHFWRMVVAHGVGWAACWVIIVLDQRSQFGFAPPFSFWLRFLGILLPTSVGFTMFTLTRRRA